MIRETPRAHAFLIFRQVAGGADCCCFGGDTWQVQRMGTKERDEDGRAGDRSWTEDHEQKRGVNDFWGDAKWAGQRHLAGAMDGN